MASRTSSVGNFNFGDTLTDAHVDSLPAGWLGFVSDTTGQGSITTEASLTGLSQAVSVNASRRLLITVKASVQSTVANDTVLYKIKEGATILDSLAITVNAAGGPGNVGCQFSTVVTPTAGTHTYNVTLARTSGTGTLSHIASSSQTSFLLVQDVGPA